METQLGRWSTCCSGEVAGRLHGCEEMTTSNVFLPTPFRVAVLIHSQELIALANGIAVEGRARTRTLIIDGNIGAQFLNHWCLTVDLAKGRV